MTLRFSPTGWALPLAALVLCALPATSAPAPKPIAAPPPAEPGPSLAGPLRYKVRRGDTLPRLTAHYLVRGSDYRVLQRINNIANPERLAAGSTISIPRPMLKLVLAGTKLYAYRGSVIVNGRKAQLGEILREGMRIETGADSSATLAFTDGSSITMPSQSALRVERLRRVLISRALQREFKLETGRTFTGVVPSTRDGDTFSIRTPVSVAAVRGTVFRVSVLPGAPAATAEVLRGAVGLAGNDGTVALEKGFGARSTPESSGKPVKLLPPPEVVVPIRPRVDGTLFFNLVPVQGAVAYRLLVAKDSGFLQVMGEASAERPSVKFPPIPVGVYHVRVSAVDKNGLEGLPADYPYDHLADINIIPKGARLRE